MPPMPPPETQRVVPTEEDIRQCITNLHQLAGFIPGCLVVSLIYIERLRRSSGAQMLATTWQPMLLIAVIVAQKARTPSPQRTSTLSCPTKEKQPRAIMAAPRATASVAYPT